MKNLYAAFLCILGILSSITQSQAKSFSSITGNTIGSDQVICSGSTPTPLTGSIPGGGIGVYTYQWQVSSTSAIAGFANAATTQGYAPGALTANRWYRRIVFSGVESDTTVAVAITVTPVITPASNAILGTQTICYNTKPSILSGPAATGGNGTYSYQWQSSPDNLTYTNIAGATTANRAQGFTTATTWFKRVVTSGGCTSTSNAVLVTVTPVVNPGSNTIGVSQSICNGQTPLALTGSTPTGANGTFTYLWEASITSATTGFTTAPGTFNGKNYAPPALTQSTWYHRITRSGGCADTSAAIMITVVFTPPGNPAVFGNGVWNIYGYSDNAFGTYAGFYTEPVLSFSTTSRYTSAQSPSYASGYQGCLIPTTNYSVSMKQTNFTPGSYQLNIDSLDDNLTVFLNGTQIYTKACCVTGGPITNVWTGNLGAADQVELRWTQATGPSFLSVHFLPVTPAPLVPGTVAQNLQVCYGEAPPSGFTNTASPTSGCTLTGMQWQKSIDSVTWVAIPGATALTYTETAALTQTTWYRRLTTDACANALATPPVKVTVNVVAPGDPTVYGNNVWNVYLFQGTGTPGPYNASVYKGYYTEPLLSFDSRNRWASTASPSNASGYQGCVMNTNNTWVDYKRTNFTSAIYQIDIPWHDDAAYLFINGIAVFTHVGCCDAHTNVWTGPLGPTDQVEYRISQGGGPSYEVLTLTPVTPPALTGGLIVPSQTICAGNVPPTPFTESFPPSGGCTLKNYSWDYSTDNGVTWNLISGATTISYTPTSSVYTQTLYRRTVYDVCGNSAVSLPDTVYMNNSAPGNPAVFGNNTWNVYCFQDVNYSIYAGYYTEPLLTFATTNRYPSTATPSSASGYLGCQLINTYYSVSMKRTGFTAGLYQIDVTADDDYNLIYINGALVSSLTYPTIQNNVWTGNLGPTDQIEIRWRNNAGPGQTGVRFTIVTATPLLPGSIAAYNPSLCFNDLPIINEVTPASGGCFVNYSWQSSVDGGSTWVTISGATGNSYTATVSPTTNIQYRRVATDVCGTVQYSAPVLFTQTAGSVGDPTIYGSGVWNVYAYDAQGAGFSTSKYLGYYVEPLLSFNSLNRWGTNGAPSDASGYQGCQVDQDNHWVSYRQTNFTPGTYQIDVPYHDDDAYLFVNGVQVWSQTGCCVASANVWTGVLGATDKVEFRWREFFGGSSGALNFTAVTPPTTIVAGTIAASQTICSGTIPAAFTSTADATSSCSISYQWQSSLDNITWTDITGAVSNVYTSGPLTVKTYFRRKANNSCAVSDYSNTILVDVYSTTITGGTVGSDQTLCTTGTPVTPAVLNSVTLPTGGNGIYSYQWQSSLDNIGWSNIAGATAATYAPTAISATTYYRRNVTACGAASAGMSNVVTVLVNSTPVITTQPANPTACAGNGTSISVVATGTAITYQWQVNTGSGFANVTNAAPYSGATTATLSINPVTLAMGGYTYRVIITGSCTPPVTSNTVTLTTGTNPTISTQPLATTAACATSTVNINVTASGSGLTYQWQQKIGAGAWVSLTDGGVYSGTQTANLVLTGVTTGMNNYNYQVIINSSCGGTITSTIGKITVVAAINNVIAADQNVCSGFTAANLTGTGGGSSYTWQVSTVSASAGFITPGSGATGQNYAPNPVSATSYYQRIYSNGTCSNTSNVVTITYNNTPLAIATQPVAQAACPGGTATFTATATGPGTLTYLWYENGVALTDGGVYSGTTTNTLTLTGVTAGMNNNSYVLRVFSPACGVSFKNSSGAILTTNSAPTVTSNTPDFSTCQGSSVQINILATGIGLGYQWQFDDGSGWSNLSNFGSYSNVNGNSLRINPTLASMNGYKYRCVVTGTCAPTTAYSATTILTVNSPVANNSIANSQTLCAGTPVPFTGSTPTGGTGTYTYQWYSNTGSGWFAIAGATGINYTPGLISQTTQFLRQVTSGACAAVNSTAITVTILPPTSTTDPVNTTTCAGTNTTLSVTATGSGLSYQWQVFAGGIWNTLINNASYNGVTTATLTIIAPPYVYNGFKYRCVVGGGCTPLSVNSNAATLTVSPVAIITAQPANVNTCAGSNAVYKVTATGTGMYYQWMEKVGAGAFTNITDGGQYSGATTATLTVSGVTVAQNNNQYQCVITIGTCPVTSLIASLTVSAQPSLVITNPATVCAPATVDITAPAVTAGSTLNGGILTYWKDITFTTPVLNPTTISVSGTYYIRVATSAVCYDIKPVVVTISPTIVNNSIAAAQAICTGSAPAGLTGTTPTGGNSTYAYQWQQSTDNITYTNITGATSGNYSPGALTTTTWYRRVVNSGTCSGTSASVQITVVAYPTATIAYPSGAYCANGTATVTQTGQTGGTYSATPAGLSIDASTGTINLTTSAAGAYTVTYSFSNGTCGGTTTVPVTISALPSANISYTGTPYCAAGIASVTQTGQTGGTYTAPAGLSIDASTGAVNLATSTVGSYTVTYSFSNGTCSNTATGFIAINALPTAAIFYAGSPYCATGTATVSQSGPAGGTYTATPAGLSLNAATGAINLTLSTPNTYSVVYSFTNGTCSNSTPATVIVLPVPTVVITNPAAICAPGTVNLTAAAVTAGSTASLTYTYFTDAAATTTLTGPAAVATSGTYYIKGTTAAGCSDIKPVVVTINPKPTVVITAPAAICAPGVVDLTDAAVTAGSTAGLTFTYFTNAAGTTVLATPNAVATSGTYYIKGSTAAGCSDIKPVVVVINPKPTVTITNPAAVCAPGTVNITAAGVTTGSTAGLTYTYFTDAAGTLTLATPNAVATGGTYYIKGTTAAGCSDIKPVVVTINPKPTVVITDPAAVCAPSTVNLTAAAITAGSTTALTFTYFKDAAGTVVLTTPAAVATSGTYYIKGSTASGCTDIQPVVVTINPKPTVTITNPAAVCAPGTVDITLPAVTAGSTAGLTFTYFSDAAGTLVVATPAAIATSGTYYIRGSSAAGCSDIKPVVVTVNPKPTVAITNPAAVCAPATVNLTAAAITTGSTTGLTYTYYSDAAATTALTGANAVSVSGTYYIKGTAASGCFDIKPVVVTINSKPSVVITNPAAVCAPATVDLTAAAVTAGSTTGLTFTYFTNAAGTTVLATPAAVTAGGTYYIRGSNASGCSDIQPVTVVVNAKPTVAITNPPAVCAPGTVNLTAAAVTTGSTTGLTFTYFTDAAATTALATPAAVTASGTYYVKGTNASGCSDIKPVVVTISALPVAGISYAGSPFCKTGTVSPTITGITGGTFTAPAGVTINAATGVINLATSTPGVNYVITYSFTNGTCANTTTTTITINALPTAAVFYAGSPYCATGTATVSQSGQAGGTYTSTPAGLSLNASTGDIDLAASTTGITYTVTYAFTNGTCSNTTTTTVLINVLPNLVITNPAAVCAPGTVNLTAAAVTAGSAAGLTYTYFTDAAATIALASPGAVTVSGTYYIKGTSASNCATIKPVVVTINPKPAIVIVNPAAVCAPATVDITAAAVTAGSTAGLTYTYFTNAAGTTVLATPAAVAVSGTYYIKGSSAAGCSDIQPVVVTINAKPAIVITNPAAVCAPGTVDITAAAVTAGSATGLTYTYFTDAAATLTLATPNAVATGGTYYIKGTSATGCSDVKAVVVTINAKPTVVITDPAAVCAPGTVNLTAAAVTAGSTTGLTFTYFTDAATTIALATPNAVAASGTYYIKGSTAAGCSDVKAVVVTINAKPAIVVTNPAAVCAPGTIDITAAAITAGSAPGLTYTYFSDAGGTLTLATPGAITTSGTYYIKGTSGTGCADIKPVVVTINPLPVASIVYAGTPYCANGTASITQTGQTGGMYTSSPAGLSLNATTGAVNLTASTPGTYTVTYTFTNGTCGDSKSAPINIITTPSVVITNPAAACAPATVDLTAAAVTAGSTPGLTYTYYTDAAGTIAVATPAAVASGGTYYIKGSAGSGCSDIKAVVVTINAKPSVVITNPAAVCTPSTIDLTAAAVTSGSTAGLTYTYFTDAGATTVLTNPNAVALPGNYYIKGTNASGCSDVKPVNVTFNALPVATISYAGGPYCKLGTASVTLTGQTGGFFTAPAGVVIDGTTGAINLASSTPGINYVVTYSFSNGTCSSTTTATITINALPTATITYTGSPYCGTGTATVTQAGQGGGTYAASPAGLSIDAATGAIDLGSSTPAVMYTVTYSFSNGTCANSTTATVFINAVPNLTITDPIPVCIPATVDLTAASVTAGSTTGLILSYYTDAAATVALATPNAVATSGTYYIKGTTAAGCSAIKAVVATINVKPTVVITNPAAVCAPATVDLTATGITAGSTAALTYTYYTDAAGTTALTGANAVAAGGTYYIKGSNGSGCSDIQPVIVTVNPKPIVAVTNPAPVCSPSTIDLTLPAVTAGSTTGLTYSYYTDAAATTVLTNPNAVATAGTYYIKGTTAAGCSDVKPVVVTFNTLPVATIGYAAGPYCKTGTALVTLTGQTGGFFTAPAGIVIDGTTGTINLATSVSGGPYTITYTFSNGTCSSTATTTIIINALPTATITYAGSPYCATGTALVTQAGQAGGTYAASPAGLVIDASSGTIDLAASTAGVSYTVTYSFGNGTCNNSTTTIVFINPLPVLVINNPAAVCTPATVDLTAAAITTGSGTGITYTYFTDAAGTVALATPNAVATSGTYYIMGTTAAGCSAIKPVVVTVNTKPTLVISNPAPVCAPATADLTDASITAGSTTGLTFTYYTDAAGTLVLANANALAASGTYYIKGSNASGCFDIQPVVVTINPKPAVVITNPTAVCPPSTIDLTLPAVTTGSTAALTFTYYTDAAGTTVLTNPNAVAVAGIYYIKGTTAAGCSDIQPVTVSFNALPVATISYDATPYCKTGTAVVTLTGVTGGFFTAPTGVTIDGLTGTINLGSSIPGTYQISYTSSNGICSGTSTTNITINALPNATINYPGTPYCATGLATVTLAGQTGGTFTSTTGLVIDPVTGTVDLAASTPAVIPYVVKYAFGNGTCTNTTTTQIYIIALPVSTIAYTGTPYCTNGTAIVSLTGVGGGVYSSSAGLSLNAATGDINLNASTENTYTVAYNVTSNGCSYATSTVIEIKNPTVVIHDPAGVCYPATINLTDPAITAGSQAGLTFNYYQDNAGTVPVADPTAVPAGSYFVKGVNTLTGCFSNIQPVTVVVNAKPAITASASSDNICKGTTITLTASSPGNTIDWPGLGTGSPIIVTPMDSITYLAVATDANGCMDTASVPVAVKPFRLVLTANPDPVLAGTNTTLTTTGNFTYDVLSWSPDVFFADQTAKEQNIVVKDTSKSFTVIALSSDGCKDTATLYVTVDPNLKDFFIPNAFSPNNDGTNDLFKVYGSSVRDVTMRIYNQWGELVYESQNATGGWDGTWKGRPQAVGVYVYVAQVTFYNNVTMKRKGTINLIR